MLNTSNDLRILFIGCVEFSRLSLLKIIELNANIVAVCTKDKSKFNSDYADLKQVCIKNQIEFRYVSDINSKENIEWIKNLKPDIIFCFGWSYLIKEKLLKVPPMGVLGFHPTKLPENRGRHPLIWSLALGIKESASTFFFMKGGADDGDILSQKKFKIQYNDDAKSLYNKVTRIALDQIESFFPKKLLTKNFQLIRQNNSNSNIWRKRSKFDGQIDFRMSSNAIYNLVRALTKPYIGAHLTYNGKDIKIWKVKEKQFSKNNYEFGKIINVKGRNLFVKTYDGAIEIVDHEFVTLPKKGEYL